MECGSIPCEHIFVVLKHTELNCIPQCCVPRRWTMGAKAAFPSDTSGGMHVWSDQMDYYRELCNKGKEAFLIASRNKERLVQVLDFLQHIIDENDDSNCFKEAIQSGPTVVQGLNSNQSSAERVHDPICVNPRGAPRKRCKNFTEKRTIHCGYWGNQITHSADAHFFKGTIEIQDGTRQRTVPQPFALSTQRRSSGGGHGVVHPSCTGENSGDKSNSSPASLIKKIVEILKDRPSWFRDCRSLEVFTMLPARNGGTIELVNMQMCAPTTLVPARDFWTLRYTTTMEDGSLVVCERSFSGSGGGPSTASAQQFVRAEMLPSGYLVRPCKGGSSIVHIVEYLDLEAWSVPEVLRPLYESSRVVAQKMTTGALRHIRQIAKETSGEAVYALGRYPAVLRWRKPAWEAGYYAANCQWRGCK